MEASGSGNQGGRAFAKLGADQRTGFATPQRTGRYSSLRSSRSADEIAKELGPILNVFLRMIKSLIAPLLFSAFVIGITEHGDDLKQVGKLTFRSIIYFEVVTTRTLVVDLVAVNPMRASEDVAATAATGAATDRELLINAPQFRRRCGC